MISSAYLNLTPPESASYKEADRHWFAANGRRTFLLRRVLPSEPVPDGEITHVLVRQIVPGMREKLFMTDGKFGHALDLVAVTDAALSRLWQAADSQQPIRLSFESSPVTEH